MIPIRHHAETFTCLWLLFGGRDTRSMTVVERHVLRPSYDVYYDRHTMCMTAAVFLAFKVYHTMKIEENSK